MTRTPLTVHNAEIHTATIEVQTLTLGGKQVTLAVFRQLPNRQIVDDDGTLLGTPWGWVNYCPTKDCAKLGNHRHIVWQDDGKLWHAIPTEPHQSLDWPIWLDAEVLRPFVYTLLAEGWEPTAKQLDCDDDDVYADITTAHGVKVRGVVRKDKVLSRYVSPSAQVAYRSRRPESMSWAEHLKATEAQERSAARADIVAEVERFGGWEAIRPTLTAAIESVQEHRRRQWAAWNALTGLPQLFIAV